MIDQHDDADAVWYREEPCLVKGTASAVPKKPGRRPYRSAEGRSEARRAKRLIYCPLLLLLAFIFLRFPPKNRMSSPKTT